MSVRRDEKRKTNQWYFVVDVRGVNGRRQQVFRRGFRSKQEAEAARAEVLGDAAKGKNVRKDRTTVGAYLLEEWLPAKAPTLKASTLASYRQALEVYVVPRIGGDKLSHVDGALLNALYGQLLASGRAGRSGAHKPPGLSPKSVRNIHGILHRAFADAVRWRRLDVNPCDAADQPRNVETEQQAWTPAELRTFLEHASSDRHGALWRLLATTGMRRGELLGLRWSDIDLEAARLTIRTSLTMVGGRPETDTPKSRAANRTVALDAGTVKALRSWKKAQASERLLMGAGWRDGLGLLATEPDGAQVHPQVFSRRFGVLAKGAGVRRIRLHDVRHSYATTAIAAGVPIKVLSQRLGHADVGVTLRVYAHVLPGDDERAAEQTAAAIFGAD